MINNDYEKKIKDLNLLNIFQIGDLINEFGNKYKNVPIKDIYKNNKNYIKWVKESTKSSKLNNEWNFKREYSRQALILYYDMMNFLKSQGK